MVLLKCLRCIGSTLILKNAPITSCSYRASLQFLRVPKTIQSDSFVKGGRMRVEEYFLQKGWVSGRLRSDGVSISFADRFWTLILSLSVDVIPGKSTVADPGLVQRQRLHGRENRWSYSQKHLEAVQSFCSTFEFSRNEKIFSPDMQRQCVFLLFTALRKQVGRYRWDRRRLSFESNSEWTAFHHMKAARLSRCTYCHIASRRSFPLRS